MKRQEKAGTPVPTSKDSEQPLIGGCGLSPEKAETAEPMLPLEASPTSPSEPNADGRMTDAPAIIRRSRRHLAKEGDAILKRARCDTMTAAKQDRQYRRNKRAESKRFGRHRRAERKKLGKFGAASPVRTIPPDGC